MNAFAAIGGVAVREADLSRESEAIDRFVAAHPDAQPFHRAAWGLAIERGTGQRAHYLLALQGELIAGVLPLTEIRSRLFGNVLVSTGFGVGGGILADDPATAEALGHAASALARQLGCPGVELRGGLLPRNWQRREGIYAGFSRQLPEDGEAILKAIPRKQRAEVRRAQGLGLEAMIGRSERDRNDHYRVYSESVRNLGTPIFPRSLFAATLDWFGPDADILTVRKGNRPIASVVSLYFKNTVYPYWGGGVFEARELRANELMYYELMRHAARRGCTRFDFGRSKLGTGAFAYKKNWGFEPTPLTYAVWTDGGEAPREINPLSPKYRLQVALWKRLPLSIANRLGPPIARGLG